MKFSLSVKVFHENKKGHGEGKRIGADGGPARSTGNVDRSWLNRATLELWLQ